MLSPPDSSISRGTRAGLNRTRHSAGQQYLKVIKHLYKQVQLTCTTTRLEYQLDYSLAKQYDHTLSF